MTNDILNRLIPILRHPRIDVKVAAERDKVCVGNLHMVHELLHLPLPVPLVVVFREGVRQEHVHHEVPLRLKPHPPHDLPRPLLSVVPE